MNKLNCLAIDDEPFALEIIKDYISKIPFWNLVETFDNGLSALHYLRENQVDVIFLDIQMPELTGIQLLKVLQNKPQIIFTTAYDKYALESYELNVTDYLLKPIPFERFYVATEKALAKSQTAAGAEDQMSSVITEERSQETFMFVKTENRIQKIEFADILYIEGMKDYLRIVTEAEKIMTLMSFKKLMELLPQSDFVRVHKSYVIPLKKVETIERNNIKIKDKFIPIGESYRSAFYELLQSKKLL